MSLSEVCLVVDFDGFYVDKKFYAREMGFSSLTKDYYGSFRFKLNHLYGSLTEKDWQCVKYTTNFIHGLSFRSLPWENELFRVENLKDLLRNEYLYSKTAEKYRVAFKGGHLEKDVLEEMEIPHVNLEDFGCPKFERLEFSLKNFDDCGYHVKHKKGISVHCPMVEARAFAEWVKDHS